MFEDNYKNTWKHSFDEYFGSVYSEAELVKLRAIVELCGTWESNPPPVIESDGHFSEDLFEVD